MRFSQHGFGSYRGEHRSLRVRYRQGVEVVHDVERGHAIYEVVVLPIVWLQLDLVAVLVLDAKRVHGEPPLL